MNPADLALTGDIGIGGRSYQGVTSRGDDLAAAGGALWVTSGGRLLRVSPRTAKVTAVIPLPGVFSSGVDASAAILIVSEADGGGLGSVQRRDPVTGALIASHPMGGVTAPGIGVIGSGVWVAEPTGMLGYIERFSTATMAPDPATELAAATGSTSGSPTGWPGSPSRSIPATTTAPTRSPAGCSPASPCLTRARTTCWPSRAPTCITRHRPAAGST